MVWAIVFVLSLWYASPALAEPVEDVTSLEEVEETPIDSPSDFDSSDGDAVEQPEVLDVPLSGSDSAEIPSFTDTGTRSANSIYGSLSPNSSYLPFFAAYLPKMSWGDDYVCWRSGQYEYRLVYGGVSYSNGSFSGSDCTHVVLTTNSGGNYGTELTISVTSGNFTLNPSNYIVYSSLGGYPVLDSSWTALCILIFCASVALVCSLLRSIWSWLLRSGQNVFLS